jgi:AcrR family transcriptional regulator
LPKQTFFNLPPEKRRLLTDLTLDEFAAHSYHAASLSRIVERAGIAKGSMYQYFQDKFDLYLYALKLGMETKLRILNEAFSGLDPEASLFERLMAATRAGLKLAQEEPVLYTVGNNLARETDPALLTRVLAGLQPAADNMLSGWFTEAAARGELDPGLSPAAALYVVSAVIWQLGQDLAAGRMPFDGLEPLLGQVFDVLKHGLAPRGQ